MKSVFTRHEPHCTSLVCVMCKENKSHVYVFVLTQVTCSSPPAVCQVKAVWIDAHVFGWSLPMVLLRRQNIIALSLSVCRCGFMSQCNRIHGSHRFDREQWEGLKKDHLCIVASPSVCDRAESLRQVSNPVSSITDELVYTPQSFHACCLSLETWWGPCVLREDGDDWCAQRLLWEHKELLIDDRLRPLTQSHPS